MIHKHAFFRMYSSRRINGVSTRGTIEMSYFQMATPIYVFATMKNKYVELFKGILQSFQNDP